MKSFLRGELILVGMLLLGSLFVLGFYAVNRGDTYAWSSWAYDATVTMKSPEELVWVARHAGRCHGFWKGSKPNPGYSLDELSQNERRRLDVMSGLSRLHQRMYEHLDNRMYGSARSILDDLDAIRAAASRATASADPDDPFTRQMAAESCSAVGRPFPSAYR